MDDFRADLEVILDIWMILAGEFKLPLTIVVWLHANVQLHIL